GRWSRADKPPGEEEMRELMVEAAGAELAVRVSRPDGEALLLGGTLRLYLYGSLLFPPNPLRRWAMRHVMTETWHNYFLDPWTAPDPDREWLARGCPEALLRTDRSLSRADGGQLLSLQDYTGPVLVLYGADDIFGASEATLRGRFPQATQGGSGHLHWLQNPASYQAALRSFYAPISLATV